MLNSMSGTWGKKDQYEKVQKFKQGLVPDSISDKLNSNKIRDLKFIHDFDGHIHASYYDNCPSQATRGTNVSLIAFITSYARIHLHRHVTKMDYANLLYCDSDSMHMVCKKGSSDPLQTSKLSTGYFKLEHTGMKQWYSLGPKMYAMSTDSSNEAYALGSSSVYAMSTNSSDKVYALGSSSAYADSSDKVYLRAKRFRVNKGFLDKSDFDGLLPTKDGCL
jgi:hypothetical protein